MKKWMISLVVVFALVAGSGLYFFFKKPRDVRDAKADVEITASEFGKAYEDEQAANTLFLGKVVVVAGVVAGIEEQNGELTVFLDTGDPLTGITCSFYPDERTVASKLQRGDSVRIKGECTGKLIDIVLNHCSVMK